MYRQVSSPAAFCTWKQACPGTCASISLRHGAIGGDAPVPGAPVINHQPNNPGCEKARHPRSSRAARLLHRRSQRPCPCSYEYLQYNLQYNAPKHLSCAGAKYRYLCWSLSVCRAAPCKCLHEVRVHEQISVARFVPVPWRRDCYRRLPFLRFSSFARLLSFSFASFFSPRGQRTCAHHCFVFSSP